MWAVLSWCSLNRLRSPWRTSIEGSTLTAGRLRGRSPISRTQKGDLRLAETSPFHVPIKRCGHARRRGMLTVPQQWGPRSERAEATTIIEAEALSSVRDGTCSVARFARSLAQGARGPSLGLQLKAEGGGTASARSHVLGPGCGHDAPHGLWACSQHDGQTPPTTLNGLRSRYAETTCRQSLGSRGSLVT